MKHLILTALLLVPSLAVADPCAVDTYDCDLCELIPKRAHCDGASDAYLNPSPAPDSGDVIVVPGPTDEPGPAPDPGEPKAAPVDIYGETLPMLGSYSVETLQGWHDDAASGGDTKSYLHYRECWKERANEQLVCKWMLGYGQ